MGLRVGAITFGGLASGLDTGTIIEKLLELEKRPITLLEKQRDSFSTRLEIFKDLDTKTRTLRDSLRTLDNLNLLGTDQSAEEEFSRFSATSTDSDVVTASATGFAKPGSLEVRVTALATADRYVSNSTTSPYASEDDAVGEGTFGIQIGSGGFQYVTIDSSNNSVAGLVEAINDAGLGVTASILDDGSATNPIRIVIQADDTGSANTLSFDDNLSGGTNPSFDQTQAAGDATLLLDPDGANPVTITSSTNTFSDVLTGVTIQAKEVSEAGTSERIEIEPDLDAIVEGIQALITAFNAVTSVIQEQFEVDPTTNRGGPLIGDSTLSSLAQRLTSAIASQYGSGDITAAAQIGISIDSNAQLSLDTDELRAALEDDFDAVKSFFAGEDGFADSLRTVADSFVDAVDGALTARIQGASSTIQDINDQIQSAQDRLNVVEENFVRQFAALERILSEVQIQGNFLAQFLVQQQR